MLILPIVYLTACEEFLSKEPDSTRASIKTPEEVSKLLVTSYPNAGYVVFGESMSDNVNDKGTGQDDKTNRFSYMFQEVEDDVNQEDSPSLYWVECYRAISVANEALDIISHADDPTKFEGQKGEALVARAYAHFMLVNNFSKFYDPATAASDPGVPYVTIPETVVIKSYQRGTVAQVYEQIEKDLLEGLPLIFDGSYTVPKYHFTQSAANAFAARFYLVKKDYAKVVQYCNQVFPTTDIGPYLRPWNTTYADMSPAELTNIYSRATEPANLLLVETSSLYGRYVARYWFGMDYLKWLEISSSEQIFGGNASWVYPLYYQGDNNYFVPKLSEYFVRESVNAEIGYPYVMLPIFTAEEVLFNRAEANAFLGRSAEAITDLNLYASKRLRNYNATTFNLTTAKMTTFFRNYPEFAYTTNNIVNTVLAFKRTEFLQEGMRWFDVQRMGIPVVHNVKTGQVISVPKGDPRRVLQIPQAALAWGLEKNAR